MTRAAPQSTRVLAQARFDALTLLRNGEQLLAAIILPGLALVAFTMISVPELTGRRIDVVTPGVLALALVSTAFTGQAIATAFDRRYGVLRLLGVTPLGRGGLILGRIIAIIMVEVIQFAVISAIALAMGWSPRGLGLLVSLPFWIIGTAAFVSMALLIAGTMRAEAVLAVANLLWVFMVGLGTVLPTSEFPGIWGSVVSYLPSGALGDGLRAAFIDGQVNLSALLVLTIWAALFGFAARRRFTWSD